MLHTFYDRSLNTYDKSHRRPKSPNGVVMPYVFVLFISGHNHGLGLHLFVIIQSNITKETVAS